MSMVVVRNSRIPKLVSLFFPVSAITLWPFVFIREGHDTPRLLTHESIHIKQYNELLVLGFPILYIYDWVIGLCKYRCTKTAYYQIRFEQEAREFESDPDYPTKRERFEWKYFTV